jgi:hypothetical protein
MQLANNENRSDVQQKAAAKMAKARDLLGKTSAFHPHSRRQPTMDLDEQPGGQRFSFAQQAMRLADVAGMVTSNVQHNDNRSDTTIGNINVHTAATDAAGLAGALRQAISAHPLLGQTAQGTVALSTRAMQ